MWPSHKFGCLPKFRSVLGKSLEDSLAAQFGPSAATKMKEIREELFAKAFPAADKSLTYFEVICAADDEQLQQMWRWFLATAKALGEDQNDGKPHDVMKFILFGNLTKLLFVSGAEGGDCHLANVQGDRYHVIRLLVAQKESQ
jgi:hypothetical protein